MSETMKEVIPHLHKYTTVRDLAKIQVHLNHLLEVEEGKVKGETFDVSVNNRHGLARILGCEDNEELRDVLDNATAFSVSYNGNRLVTNLTVAITYTTSFTPFVKQPRKKKGQKRKNITPAKIETSKVKLAYLNPELAAELLTGVIDGTSSHLEHIR